ncbi:DUF86 domain-containing protein [Bacillus solitudinis]|uniref:DUF86 domain-containing protein n=1 Tax=Bacillus solitudinis TaxID=2014074 RepID=UPI000C236EF5|nr:DUF86 domain-containing protein [Bacillus solitudinis]
MYFVNREKIEQTLRYYEELLKEVQHLNSVETRIEQLALERILYVIIESVIDVGNSMIDGFIMRDPGGYEDIVDILEDESVIINTDAESIKEVIRCRKTLVQDYNRVNHDSLLNVIHTYFQSLESFPKAIRRYLVCELGPVSAFLPEKTAD